MGSPDDGREDAPGGSGAADAPDSAGEDDADTDSRPRSTDADDRDGRTGADVDGSNRGAGEVGHEHEPAAGGHELAGDEREPADGHGNGHHVEHRSRWPTLAAAGAAGLYAGVGIVLIARATGLAPQFPGFLLAAVGAVGLLGGLAGWLEEAFLAPAREATSARKSRESYVSTAVLFLVTDVGTFGALFVYYFVVRVRAWPPQDLPPLVGSLVLVNTVILLASSATIHYAHEALEEGHRRRFLGLLGTTLVLGIVFLGGQVYEYYEFVAREGFTLSSGVFGSAFFGLTGLHGFHVALGVGAFAILTYRALRGQYGPDRDASIATVSLYWHFVDAVWLFLVAVLYVGAAI